MCHGFNFVQKPSEKKESFQVVLTLSLCVFLNACDFLTSCHMYSRSLSLLKHSESCSCSEFYFFKIWQYTRQWNVQFFHVSGKVNSCQGSTFWYPDYFVWQLAYICLFVCLASSSGRTRGRRTEAAVGISNPESTPGRAYAESPRHGTGYWHPETLQSGGGTCRQGERG